MGAGAPRSIAEVRRLISTAGAEHRVVLRGPLAPAALHATLGGYAGFLMPTRRETLGMVFIEALFAGLPILHTRGWGIDGFFDDEIGYACDPDSSADVVAGIRRLVDNEAALKANVARLNDEGALERFRRAEISGVYGNLLERTLSGVRRVQRSRKPEFSLFEPVLNLISPPQGIP